MTLRVEVCETIAAMPHVVWVELEAIEQHVHWMNDAATITFRGERRRGVGTEFECLTRVGPLSITDEFLVTGWEQGRQMSVEHRGAVKGVGEFVLEPCGAHRTRMCWRERLRFPWWMGGPVGEVAAWPVLRSLWRGNLRRLRARIEAGSSSGS